MTEPIDDTPVVSEGAPAEPPQWQERDAWTALDDLDVSPALVPASEWPAGLAAAGVTCLDRPGLYAWWVDEVGAADLTRGLAPGRDLTIEAGRIHLGQAGATKWPSGRSNDDTLGRRIGEVHLGGRVRMSTLRWTLASILCDQLELRGQAAMLINAPSEQAVSEWMRAHLSVALHPHDDRDTLGGLDQALLERLDPPLNLGRMGATPVRGRIADLRRRISREP
ncbi:MAG TPA: hypothetical protein VFD50_09780 [Thermoleophilia bacterium]|nr:hypothetical protein [Thermoleophilia bacterium]